MVRCELIVTNPRGIHARPSSLIVETARSLDSSIHFIYKGERFAADNIMDVLSMGAECGAGITVEVDGGNEEGALERIREIFALNFSDEP